MALSPPELARQSQNQEDKEPGNEHQKHLQTQTLMVRAESGDGCPWSRGPKCLGRLMNGWQRGRQSIHSDHHVDVKSKSVRKNLLLKGEK